MNAKLLISNDDALSWSDGSAQPLFTISQETVERVRDFRNTHPDISTEFFTKELNSAIVEMLFRIEREYNGE
ncbi:MAG TPA: hypothetical protein VEP90_10685 [Methylomirabilota bacterium]|nr:hypothetical protein [Methylomirabilota bacterium]